MGVLRAAIYVLGRRRVFPIPFPLISQRGKAIGVPFFDALPEPPPELETSTEQPWSPPLWDRPSEGTLPFVLGVSQLLGRTDNVAVALDHVRAYPNGFQLAIVTITSPRLPAALRMGGFHTMQMIAATRAAT